MLEPETLVLMREAFASQPCSKCGKPAVRMSRNRFLCLDCLPSSLSSPPEVRRAKDPKGLKELR